MPGSEYESIWEESPLGAWSGPDARAFCTHCAVPEVAKEAIS
jgi:hypothetical protein